MSENEKTTFIEESLTASNQVNMLNAQYFARFYFQQCISMIGFKLFWKSADRFYITIRILDAVQ